MIYFLLLIQIFLIRIGTAQVSKRALNVKTCENQSPLKWMVSIQNLNNPDKRKHDCNGVILEKRAILSTGICCDVKLKCNGDGPFPHIQVVHGVGEPNSFPKGKECTIASVVRCIIHPLYSLKRGYVGYVEYDACILELGSDLQDYEEAPLALEFHKVKDYAELCRNATVIGRWYHTMPRDPKLEEPDYKLQCFDVTIKTLKSCAEVTTFVYLRKSHNFTLTCSYDASNRYEVCGGFYGAALMCANKVVGLVSHKFNLTELCLQVTPFYHTRIDWLVCFVADWYQKNNFKRAALEMYRSQCLREFQDRSLIYAVQDGSERRLRTTSHAHTSSMENILYVFWIIIYAYFLKERFERRD